MSHHRLPVPSGAKPRSGDSRRRTLALLAASVALAGSGCGRGEKTAAADAAAPPVVVTLESTLVRPTTRHVDVVGTLHGELETTLSALVAGRIVTIAKDLGDLVEPGGSLARVDPVDYQLEIEQRRAAVAETLRKIGLDAMPGDEFDVAKVPQVERARLQAENDRAKYERSKTLFSQELPVVSEQDLQDLLTTWQVAIASHQVEIVQARALLAEARTREAEMRRRERDLEQTEVRAPEALGDGTRQFEVARRHVDRGEYVQAGEPLFDIVDPDPILLRADVAERHLSVVHAGQTATLAIESDTGEFEGIVSRVAPSVDPESRTFRVEIRFGNADRRLRPGSFGRARIAIRVDPAVTFAPAESIATFVGEKKVFSVKDGRAVEHRVRTGERDGEYVEITSGLEGEVPLVLSGLSKLADGTLVEVKSESELGATPPAGTSPQ
jgi:RND family efflux transporter MFP subunit